MRWKARAAAAVARGYHAIVMPEPVTGEARDAAPRWLDARRELIGAGAAAGLRDLERRNHRARHRHGPRRPQPRVRAGARRADRVDAAAMAMASIGTDGIDGSSGVAGGIVDSTTHGARAGAGLDAPGHYLAANDSFAFFAPLDDVVRLGRTDTNVGDLQVILID